MSFCNICAHHWCPPGLVSISSSLSVTILHLFLFHRLVEYGGYCHSSSTSWVKGLFCPLVATASGQQRCRREGKWLLKALLTSVSHYQEAVRVPPTVVARPSQVQSSTRRETWWVASLLGFRHLCLWFGVVTVLPEIANKLLDFISVTN